MFKVFKVPNRRGLLESVRFGQWHRGFFADGTCHRTCDFSRRSAGTAEKKWCRREMIYTGRCPKERMETTRKPILS